MAVKTAAIGAKPTCVGSSNPVVDKSDQKKTCVGGYTSRKTQPLSDVLRMIGVKGDRHLTATPAED
ncbi:hypothetical protein H6G89_29410 [Oscillatoria sp. FACHB-1407]|uniref:hypothetical protein n=1 Tax=Oscillatoria sp. FACHB-1407 TaxID=2692847 RepID=UPI0016856B8C|nr:hypothetical protein [Oscillatoria sp. FACHB-1407]MBD2465129.1 hypothetical protein [Oscillatoria sp. FACHB-1407]